MSEISDLLEQEVPPEIGRQICVDLRRRVAAGEAVPPEEIAKGLAILRKMYGYEAQTKVKEKKPAKEKKAKAPAVNADDLLANLLGGL